MQTSGQAMGRICVEGTEVLRYRISLPAWEEQRMPTELYGRMASAVRDFCEGALRSYAVQAYERCEAPDKRFRFSPFLYTLTGTVTYWDGVLLSVCIETVFRKRGQSEPTQRIWDAHTWSVTEDGAFLLPPRQATRAFGIALPSKRQFRGAVGVIREADSVVLYTERERHVLRKIEETDDKKGKETKNL